MTVLGSHEMAHYVMARYHGMKTSLPYFIPFPTFIGTMGAVIRYRGPVPSRKALFDVGIAGPLVGLIMSIAVTLIGLNLEAPAVKPLSDSMMFESWPASSFCIYPEPCRSYREKTCIL